MAQIPELTVPEIQPRATPAPDARIATPAEAFGGNVLGQTLGKAGQEIGQAGSEQFAYAKAFQDILVHQEGNDRAYQTAQVAGDTWAKWRDSHTLGNALPHLPELQNNLNQIFQSGAEGLSPLASQTYNEVARRYISSFNIGASDYAAAQGHLGIQQGADSSAQAAAQLYVMHPSEETRAGMITQAVSSASQYFAGAGLQPDDPQLKQKAISYTSPAEEAIIRTHLGAGDIPSASAEYQRAVNDHLLTTEAAGQIATALRSGSTDFQVQTNVQQFLAGVAPTDIRSTTAPAANATVPGGSTIFQSPVPAQFSGELQHPSSPFGPRTPPTAGASSFHAGEDIPVPVGTPIAASAGGVVVIAGQNGGFGNEVEIKHDNGYYTIYGHLSSINVQAGQRVEAGASLGASGNTGISTGPHLHFEIKDPTGKPIDPQAMLGKPVAGSTPPPQTQAPTIPPPPSISPSEDPAQAKADMDNYIQTEIPKLYADNPALAGRIMQALHAASDIRIEALQASQTAAKARLTEAVVGGSVNGSPVIDSGTLQRSYQGAASDWAQLPPSDRVDVQMRIDASIAGYGANRTPAMVSNADTLAGMTSDQLIHTNLNALPGGLSSSDYVRFAGEQQRLSTSAQAQSQRDVKLNSLVSDPQIQLAIAQQWKTDADKLDPNKGYQNFLGVLRLKAEQIEQTQGKPPTPTQMVPIAQTLLAHPEQWTPSPLINASTSLGAAAGSHTPSIPAEAELRIRNVFTSQGINPTQYQINQMYLQYYAH